MSADIKASGRIPSVPSKPRYIAIGPKQKLYDARLHADTLELEPGFLLKSTHCRSDPHPSWASRSNFTRGWRLD